MKKILLTTAIDYTNDVVHLGHSYQKVLTDSLARYYRAKLGRENVFFVTGTDEHGGNIERAAKDAQKNPKEFVDSIVEQDKNEWQALNIAYDRFIRTTDLDHIKIVEEFWGKCEANETLYKDKFSGLYCYGCEEYKTESELIDGKCPLHPTKELERIEEENWFFRWSQFEPSLRKILQTDFVLPPKASHEMATFLELGIKDIAVSRPKEKISWGIPVPGDSTQTIYVWFDALISYYSAAKEKGFWDKNTEIIHILGKDNTRWHALLWPAMLEAAGLRLPDKIYSHGFINLNGQKISKSLGNVIRPSELVSEFGADAVRYYLLRYGPATDDVDISLDKLKTVYNADLANGLGNLVQRVATLAEKNGTSFENKIERQNQLRNDVGVLIEQFKFSEALELIWVAVSGLDRYINRKAPWKQVKDDANKTLHEVVITIEGQSSLIEIAETLLPFLPESSEGIIKIFSQDNIKAPEKPLFPRII